MQNHVVAALVFGAFAHASSSALFKAAQGQRHAIAPFCISMGVIGALAVPFVTQPDSASWPYLIGSAVSEALYFALIGPLFRTTDFIVAYTMIRGLAPVTATAVGHFLLEESVSPTALAGVGIISTGIVLLGMGGQIGTSNRLRVLGGAAIVGIYSALDAIGVRKSSAPLGYACWLFIFTGLFFVPQLWIRRNQGKISIRHAAMTLAAGGGGLASYGVALWAMTQAALSSVAALRETSIAFGILISRLVFRERLGIMRGAVVLLISIGAILVRAA